MKAAVPCEDVFGKGFDAQSRVVANDGGKTGIVIDENGSPSAETADDRERCGMDQKLRFSRDAHDNGVGGAVIDQAPVSIVGADQRLFDLQLLQDRNIA